VIGPQRFPLLSSDDVKQLLTVDT